MTLTVGFKRGKGTDSKSLQLHTCGLTLGDMISLFTFIISTFTKKPAITPAPFAPSLYSIHTLPVFLFFPLENLKKKSKNLNQFPWSQIKLNRI